MPGLIPAGLQGTTPITTDRKSPQSPPVVSRPACSHDLLSAYLNRMINPADIDFQSPLIAVRVLPRRRALAIMADGNSHPSYWSG